MNPVIPPFLGTPLVHTQFPVPPLPLADFAMNRELRIVQAGPALRKACPQLSADGIHVDQALHVRGGRGSV